MLPASAILSEKSASDARKSPLIGCGEPLVFCNSTQSTCPFGAKCASLNRTLALPALMLPFGASGVGIAKRNHEVEPAGLRPRERPSSGMAALIALITVVPFGCVR